MQEELDETAQRRRARQYAECTAPLDSEDAVAGAESLWDTALTNALVAIVAHEWPGKEKDARGRVLPASGLLKVIEAAGLAEADGSAEVYVIPDPDPCKALAGTSPWPWAEAGETPPRADVRVAVGTLRDGLTPTQHVRHGRDGADGARLERRHVDALIDLDPHPALGTLSAEQSSRNWTRIFEDDRRSAQAALQLLTRIGEKEAARRAAESDWLHDGYHPKHNPGGVELAQCPVCELEAFSAYGQDDHGMDLGPGLCLVCGYERSPGACPSTSPQSPTSRCAGRTTDWPSAPRVRASTGTSGPAPSAPDGRRSPAQVRARLLAGLLTTAPRRLPLSAVAQLELEVAGLVGALVQHRHDLHIAAVRVAGGPARANGSRPGPGPAPSQRSPPSGRRRRWPSGWSG
ncbi:hypothetical protein ACFC1R_38530 [Kitasatospora sp. NPDC056138]|uniref:hypothetical protein n=1 Tax=Kitasatospora sp. NPDC056138 TaxID=3345724 RepID=UPI0035E30E76